MSEVKWHAAGSVNVSCCDKKDDDGHLQDQKAQPKEGNHCRVRRKGRAICR